MVTFTIEGKTVAIPKRLMGEMFSYLLPVMIEHETVSLTFGTPIFRMITTGEQHAPVVDSPS